MLHNTIINQPAQGQQYCDRVWISTIRKYKSLIILDKNVWIICRFFLKFVQLIGFSSSMPVYPTKSLFIGFSRWGHKECFDIQYDYFLSENDKFITKNLTEVIRIFIHSIHLIISCSRIYCLNDDNSWTVDWL